MRDKTSTHGLSRLSKTRRTVAIWLCGTAAIGGIGCATMIATSTPNPNTGPHFNEPVLTDVIFALARPDAKLAETIGTEHAIAFLGKKHTYLVVEGGDRLNNIASALDGNALTLENNPRQLFIKDTTIWGNVSLRYVPGADPARMETDLATLQSMGFTPDGSGTYRLSVAVKGVRHRAARLKQEIPGEFKKEREISFYNPPDSHPPPDLGKLVTVPLALGVDVLLTPVYALGFVILVLSI